MPPALEVVMAQNRTAHNRQIGIGSDVVVRELPNKVKQLAECRFIDFHRHMLSVEQNAVLVVVDIRRILEEPVAPVDGHRYKAMVLPRRVVHPPRIALIFHAQLAFRVPGLRGIPCSGNGSRILFRFGKVDRNLQRAVFAGIEPLLIFGQPVAADIIGVFAEGVKPVCRSFG